MKEEFYFTLYCGSFVANTYVGSRSNAKAYFKRWVRKNFPCYEDYDVSKVMSDTLSGNADSLTIRFQVEEF